MLMAGGCSHLGTGDKYEQGHAQGGDTAFLGTDMTKEPCPLGTHNLGTQPSRGHIPPRGGMRKQGTGTPRGHVLAGCGAHGFGGDSLLGDMSLERTSMARGHSALEATCLRGTQAPYTHMCPPPTCPDPIPTGLPPCHVQSPSPASGNQFAMGSSQFRAPPPMGRDNPGDHRGQGTGQGGGPPANPLPPSPPWAMPGWVELLGAVPLPGMKGLRGPVQLCGADVRYADEAERVL